MMLKGLGVTGNVVQLLDDFYFKLSLLERQSKARVLAQPSITVLNGNKATIDVGQSQFFKITSGTSDNPTYQFRPISFGITLNITPWISQSGQITADIAPEISNSVGTNADNYPNIFKRSVSTTVRLDNKQTLVLGGLLSSQDNTSDQRVPFFGDIPIIGNLFKTINKSHTQTNLVIYITPRIVEQASVDLPSELQRFEDNQRSRVQADEPIIETLKRSSTTGGTVGRRDTTAPKAPRDTTTADTAPDSTAIVPALPVAKTVSDTTSSRTTIEKDR
jgi:type IV pilus assembly protein PilQ